MDIQNFFNRMDKMYSSGKCFCSGPHESILGVEVNNILFNFCSSECLDCFSDYVESFFFDIFPYSVKTELGDMIESLFFIKFDGFLFDKYKSDKIRYISNVEFGFDLMSFYKDNPNIEIVLFGSGVSKNNLLMNKREKFLYYDFVVVNSQKCLYLFENIL